MQTLRNAIAVQLAGILLVALGGCGGGSSAPGKTIGKSQESKVYDTARQLAQKIGCRRVEREEPEMYAMTVALCHDPYVVIRTFHDAGKRNSKLECTAGKVLVGENWDIEVGETTDGSDIDLAKRLQRRVGGAIKADLPCS